MSYSAQNIRNICLLGHGGNGKTSLAESMLFLTGGTLRQGSTTDGNTVCDYDPEETRRGISIATALAPVEYQGCKINVLDTPGYFDFAGEAIEALRVSEAAVIVCSAKAGMSVGAEKAWKYCEANKLPRILYISKTDEDNSDYNAAFATLRERFGKNIAPVVAPIWDADKKVIGIIDVLHKRAYEIQNGKRVEIAVPDDKLPVLDELYDALKESVAETSEELMERYFDGDDFSYAEMVQGLRAGVKDLSIYPVVCGSAHSGLGTFMLMDIIVDLMPNPLEGKAEVVENKDGEPEEFVVSAGALPTALVFKTLSDQYGKYSFVKVLSGSLTSDMQLVCSRTGETEKIGRLYMMKGKKAEEVKEIACGDIGAIGKMDRLKTGDTICDSRKVVEFAPLDFPEPCYSVSIAPKTKGQEDKIASGLTRLGEEDQTFAWLNNAETHQMVVSGTGDMQMDVLVARLKARFGVEAELGPVRVPYREKIRKMVEAHGRHKKQSGGSGQFGDVWVRFEPQDEQDDLLFTEQVFGGSVPRNFFPAVEKGLRDSVQRGVLAGYPLVGLKATLYDGSYHSVDSNEMAFRMAAQLAYKEGIPNASPTILEPIGSLTVTIPDQHLGDVMGDLNKRRGRVMGMNPTDDGEQIFEAEVPMAEMTTYAIDLRSITQSRGSFTFRFVRYEEAPAAAQQKAIEDAKAMQE